MRLRVVFNGSIPKDHDVGDFNEDQSSTDEFRQRFALSDGASESYDSARWARLIVDAWVAGDNFLRREGLARLIRRYDFACDPPSLSWSRRAAFERGSFATLLGVSLRGSSVRVVSIGDSLAVWSDIGGETSTFPYTRASDFDRRPLLLSTRSDANSSLASRTVARGCAIRWSVRPGSALLLMTDAVGQWLLRSSSFNDSCSLLRGIRRQEEFRDFVLSQRAVGMMRRDDTTLLHLCAESS